MGTVHAFVGRTTVRDRPSDRRAWRDALVAAAAAAVVGREVGLPPWASGLAAAYAASVASSARPMRETYAIWQEQSRAWSALLEQEEVARAVHDMTSGARPAVEHAVEVLQRHDAEAGDDALRRLAAVRERAALRLSPWTTPKQAWVWEALNEGYLGGRRLTELPGSVTLVRYFAVYENTPGWLPRAVRRRAVPLLRVIDVVRLLHNDDIERRALVATVWVRVAVVAIAPLTASASLTGLVPMGSGASPVATVAYAAALTGALVSALAAPRLAAYTMGQPTRWWLFVGEQSIAIAAVVAAPCWAVALYGAGAVNWLQRPDWRLRKLFAWMTLTYVPFALAAAAQGANAGQIGAEAAIAIAATAVIAGSYGLMAPVTAATAVSALVDSLAWRVRAWGAMRVERRALRAIIDAVETGLSAHVADSADAAEAVHRARAARELIAARRTLRLRTRRLGPLLARAIADVVVPDDAPLPEGVPNPRLRAAQPVFQPPRCADLIIESGGNARRLDALVKRIVREAVDKDAEGLIRTYVRAVADDAVEIEIANARPERPLSGFGTGAQWLERDRVAIPGAEIRIRGLWTSEHPDLMGEVYRVVVRLGLTVFGRGV